MAVKTQTEATHDGPHKRLRVRRPNVRVSGGEWAFDPVELCSVVAFIAFVDL